MVTVTGVGTTTHAGDRSGVGQTDEPVDYEADRRTDA